MTHSGGKPHRVGDQGQRYEVTYQPRAGGERKKFGWATTPEGAAAMCESVRLNPGMKNPRIRDREVDPDPKPPVPEIPEADKPKKRSYDEE